jgi:NADH:ubiquinone oxidoreductase subunit 3 (subunit A)
MNAAWRLSAKAGSSSRRSITSLDLVFLIFDVETVFLFPWAVALGKLELFAVVEGIIFILILVAGLSYIWRKDALEWV